MCKHKSFRLCKVNTMANHGRYGEAEEVYPRFSDVSLIALSLMLCVLTSAAIANCKSDIAA